AVPLPWSRYDARLDDPPQTAVLRRDRCRAHIQRDPQARTDGQQAGDRARAARGAGGSGKEFAADRRRGSWLRRRPTYHSALTATLGDTSDNGNHFFIQYRRQRGRYAASA